MSDPDNRKRISGSMTVVSEEREDGTFEIRTESVEPEEAADASGPGEIAAAGEGGSAAAWIGLVAVLALLGAGAYLLFVSPRSPEREPPLVTSETSSGGELSPDGVGPGLTDRVREGGPVRIEGQSESPVIRRTLLRRPSPARLGERPSQGGIDGRPDSFQGPRGALRDRTREARTGDPAAVQGVGSSGDLMLVPGEAPREDTRETRVLGPSYPVDRFATPDAGADAAGGAPEELAFEDDEALEEEAELEAEPSEDESPSEALDDEYLDEDEYDEDEYDEDEYDEDEYDEDEYDEDEYDEDEYDEDEYDEDEYDEDEYDEDEYDEDEYDEDEYDEDEYDDEYR